MSSSSYSPGLKSFFSAKAGTVSSWRRLAALLLDYIALYIITAIIALSYESIWLGLGVDGWAIGYLIALAYFTVLQSRIGHGQSLGYKLLGLRIHTSDGDELPLQIAAGRFILFSPILFVTDLNRLVTSAAGPEIGWYAGPMFMVSVAALIPFMVLVDPLRRGLHDALMDTIVVRSDAYETPGQLPWTRSVVISLGIGALLVAAFTVMKTFDENPDVGLTSRALTQSLANEGVVSNVVVMETRLRSENEDDEPRYMLLVGGYIHHSVYSDSTDRHSILDELIREVRQSDLSGFSSDSLRVAIRSGFSLGFYSRWYVTGRTVSLHGQDMGH